MLQALRVVVPVAAHRRLAKAHERVLELRGLDLERRDALREVAHEVARDVAHRIHTHHGAAAVAPQALALLVPARGRGWVAVARP